MYNVMHVLTLRENSINGGLLTGAGGYFPLKRSLLKGAQDAQDTQDAQVLLRFARNP